MILQSEVLSINRFDNHVEIHLKNGGKLLRTSAARMNKGGKHVLVCGPPVYPDNFKVWESLRDPEEKE